MKGKLSTNFFVAIIVIVLAGFIGLIIAKTATLSLLIIPLLAVAAILFYLIIRSPELGWLLIVFFLPFERVPTLEFGGVDIKINTLLGFLTLFAWILTLMSNYKKYKLPRSLLRGIPDGASLFPSRLHPHGKSSTVRLRPNRLRGIQPLENKIQPNILAIPLSLFSIAMLLSLTQALNFSRAIAVLVFILFTIALAILAVNMVNSKENLKKTLLVLFLSSFLVGLFGLFQFGGDVIGLPQGLTLLKKGYTSMVFGFPRVQAFSMEPLYFANYLLIPICVGLALAINKVEIFKRGWLVGLLALLLINFILTVSRGGYAGLIVSLLILGIFFLKKVLTWKNVLITSLTAVIVVYGVAFALSRGEYRATNEFLGHVKLQDITEGESVEGRLVTFKNALRAYEQSPILGIGIGNYGPWAKNYPPVRPKTGWDIVNNQYIEILAETGLIGLIAYSILLIVLIFRTFIAFKYASDIFLKSVLIGLFAALGGVLVQYNFMSTLYIIHIWVLIGMLVGVQNIVLKNKMTNF